MTQRDWVDWHRSYDDAESPLSARLDVVRRMIRRALDDLGSQPIRVLSLCAGDGRDLLPELTARPDLEAQTVLIERDPVLARRAAGRAAELGLTGVRVVEADAGATTNYSEVAPVDLLLLCGIFGNVSDDDIRTTLVATQPMLAPGGYVIWTRGRFSDGDLRPAVRAWSVESGLQEVAYDGEPAPFGVGLYRAHQPQGDVPLPGRLFTFVR